MDFHNDTLMPGFQVLICEKSQGKEANIYTAEFELQIISCAVDLLTTIFVDLRGDLTVFTS